MSMEIVASSQRIPGTGFDGLEGVVELHKTAAIGAVEFHVLGRYELYDQPQGM